MAKSKEIDLNAGWFGAQNRLEWLRTRMQDKGVGAFALFGSIENPPAGLNYHIINNWLDGHTKTATWEYWIAIKKAIKEYDLHSQLSEQNRIDLTETLQGGQSRLEWLRARMRDKDVGSCALYSTIANPPAGLYQDTIQNWLKGRTKTAAWEHWVAVKHALRAYEPYKKRKRGLQNPAPTEPAPS